MTELTVGELRKALAAYSDDAPVRIGVPDETGEFQDEGYMPTTVSIDEKIYADARGTVPNAYVTIAVDSVPEDDVTNTYPPLPA
ncbi:DUF6225 family protein [Streptomyces sp. NPDC018352]|uniref:DUF6225 family protein n=1 Tax=Streptomyces sp. NPDC018352 TaxID=3157194 RepID=UPI0033C62FE5